MPWKLTLSKHGILDTVVVKPVHYFSCSNDSVHFIMEERPRDIDITKFENFGGSSQSGITWLFSHVNIKAELI